MTDKKKPKRIKKRKNPIAGQQPYEPTPQNTMFVYEAYQSGLTQEDICMALDISRPTLLKYYKRTLDKAKAEKTIAVVKKLFDAIEDGSVPAMALYLKTQAGWTENVNHQVSGKDGDAIEIKVTREVIGGDNAKEIDVIENETI